MTMHIRVLLGLGLAVALTACTNKDKDKDTPKPAPSAATTPAPVATNNDIPPASPDDHVGMLVQRLSMTPRWENGGVTFGEIADGSTHEQVANAVFKKVTYREGKVTKFTIDGTREVKIGAVPYTALSLDTNIGKRILLLRAVGPGAGFFTYVHNDDPPKDAGAK